MANAILLKLKNRRLNQEGSALILTVIILVNALLIVTAITYISVIERKAQVASKLSAPALQAADSGLEYALSQGKSMAVTDPISSMCTNNTDGWDDTNKRMDCTYSVGLGTGYGVYLYFLEGDPSVAPLTLITDGNTPLSDIYAVRSVGVFQSGNNSATSRALQAVMTAQP